MKKNTSFITFITKGAALLSTALIFAAGALFPSITLSEDGKQTSVQAVKNETKTAESIQKNVKGVKTKKTGHSKVTHKIKYTKACLNCKKEGKAAAQTKFTIPSNTKVIVLKQKNKKGWAKIKCSKGKGFVMDRYLTAKKPKVKVDKDETADIQENDSDIYDRALAKATFDQVNHIRKANGLNVLEWDASLVSASDTRAMEASAVWSHLRPDGSSWQTVSENCQGENLARRFDTAEGVCNGWMNSQGHRENILRKEFTRASVSVCEINGIYYWCQSFGY